MVIDTRSGRILHSAETDDDLKSRHPYFLAVYFGSVSVTRTRHALSCGLIADFTGILAAIFIGYLFFN